MTVVSFSAAGKKSKTNLVILRYNGVFGPGQRRLQYGSNYFLKAAREEGEVKIWGSGRELRDLLYVKTRPLLWDMKNEPGQCHFEMWIGLMGNRVHVRNRLTCFRTDDTWELRPCHQELPAVYTIGDIGNLHTYVGERPWENDELTRISNSGPPWEYWDSPEHWAALVGDDMFGVGVYNEVCTLFVGGYHGPPGGGPNDDSTGYMSPLATKELGKSSIFEYEYDLVVGSLKEIREFAYAMNSKKSK